MIRNVTFSLFLVFSLSNNLFSQDFNSEKTILSNFVRRMYESTKFEGVKIIEDYNSKYIISLVILEKSKYSNTSVLNRTANIKARSAANNFINGSTISSDMIIKTSEIKDSTNTYLTTIEETIKENANGFVEGMELLNSFDIEEGKRFVYVVYRKL